LARKEYAARHAKRKEDVNLLLRSGNTGEDDKNKLFVGNINFEDLPTDLKPVELEEIQRERILRVKSLFESFGLVEKFKDFVVSKKHCFILFKDQSHCLQAAETLKVYDNRKKSCAEMKQRIEAELGQKGKYFAPNAHFYVRLVNSVTHKKGKKKPKQGTFPRNT